MDHNKKVILVIFVLFAMLMFTGCTASQATSKNQVCPTSAAPACPSAAVQVLPTMDAWRILYNDQHANVRFTFDAGKKCSMDILRPASGPVLVYEIVVNDNTYNNYMVGTMTMDEGKTIQDLEEYTYAHTGKVAPPAFVQLQALDVIPPLTRTWHAVSIQGSPVYFGCFIEGPDPQTGIEVLGPVEITQ